VIVEVMTDALEREWWRNYAVELATRFEQKELVVRSLAFEDFTKRTND
jgi:hypothetical protein